MKSENLVKNPAIKKSRFPAKLFWTVFGLLLLVAGVQVGLIVLGLNFKWSAIFQTHLILFYWVLVSVLIVFYIKNKIYKIYDIPLQKVSDAMEKVAKGDFTPRIPVTNPPEKFDYMDVMITDLNKMIEELGGMETLRTDFIANVSHEMKTPIAAMQNYATLLQNPDLLEAERNEYAKNISSSCRRLSSLITNILKLNKLENQQIFPKVPPYDLGEQLRECILAFEEAWSAKNIEIEADIADGIFVTTDGELLSLVWNNFLSNAIKFTPDGGKVMVKAELQADNPDGKAVLVSVADSGCGMDERTKKHVFEKFFQGDTSHSSQGNGLGLALAARVAAICGAEITVESEPGKGSTFCMRLPV